MLMRVLIACSFVGLFASGFYIGQFGRSPVTDPNSTANQVNDQEQFDPLVLITSTTLLEDVPEEVATDDVAVDEVADVAQSKLVTPITRTDLPTPVVKPTGAITDEDAYVTDPKLAEELDYQRLSVDRLRTRIADLEWETLVLQSDLLARDIELANVRSELFRNYAAQPDIYNITNVPVGGYVVATPSNVPPSAAPAAVQQGGTDNLNGNVGSRQNGEQPAFFGPAPDNHEDHTYFEGAVTPHQSQETESAVREDPVKPPAN